MDVDNQELTWTVPSMLIDHWQGGKHLYSVSTGKAVKSKSLKNPIFSVTTLYHRIKLLLNT